MSITVNTYMESGRELVIPFQVDGITQQYKVICPMCGSERFMMSHDETLIYCANHICNSVIFKKPNTEMKGQIGWVI